MADNTKIEWADATVNAINGCSVTSPGCTNCYAMKLAGTRMKTHPTRKGLTVESKTGPVWNGTVRLHEPALLQPLSWSKPRRIFWNAHGDTFHDAVPDEWIDRVMAVCALTPQHTHMILTKRSKRMREYMSDSEVARRVWDVASESNRILMALAAHGAAWGGAAPWPLSNVWLGVSVEDQTHADERIPDLLATPAAVRFLSCEPLLGPVDLTDLTIRVRPGEVPCGLAGLDALTGVHWDAEDTIVGIYGNPDPRIDWVIVGGESGPGARPMHPDWARSLRDQCAAAGVPFHFKQWGEWLPGQNDIYPNWDGRQVAHHQDGTWGPIEVTRRGYVMWDEQAREYRGLATDHSYFPVHRWATRVGKKRAGRLLDDVEHNGMPESAAA